MADRRRRLQAGEANHIETLLWRWQVGRYDPLARPAEPSVKTNLIAHRRVPPPVPRGATATAAHGGADIDPGDEGEELVIVRV
jgi:hypothetical protein